MAAIPGCRVEVLAGPALAPPTQLVGYLQSFTYASDVEEIDVSTMGNCTAQIINGLRTRTLSMEGFEQSLPGTDPVPDPGQVILFEEDANLAVILRVNGTGSGKPQILFLDTIVANLGMAGSAGNEPVSNTIDLRCNDAPDTTQQT